MGEPLEPAVPTGPGQPWWGGISPDPTHWSNNIILCSVNYGTTAGTARKKGGRADG
jgi:hypothetical protein